MVASPILVLENYLELCHVIEETLENPGFAADITHSGADALQEVRRNSYPAAIMDAHLPDAEAGPLLQDMRRHQPDIGGILLARDRSLESLKARIEDGFFDVLTQPLNPHRLLTRIEELAEEATWLRSIG